MYWWVALGYPDAFDLGKDGVFPRSGQVVKYYRELKMDDKGKAWKQSDLATTLGVTETMIRNIENKDAGMSFERRQFLSKLFNIPPILLGIITKDQIDALLEEKGITLSSSPSQQPIPATVITHQPHIDIEGYRDQLGNLWRTFQSNALHSSLITALSSVDTLYRELPHVSQDKEQLKIQNLLCDYHGFISAILCEQCNYNVGLEHLDKAFHFAEGEEQKARIFYNRGSTMWKSNRIDKALDNFDGAWQFEKKIPNNLRGSILLESGRAKARSVETEEERKKVIDEIDLVGRIIRSNFQEDDPHLFKLDLDCYHLYKSSALVAVGWNKEATEELKLIKGFPGYLLRQIYYDILQAQVYVNTSEYSEAAGLAELALISAKEVNSEINIARVEEIYRHLKQSTYSDSADVARLEYLLYYKPRT